MSGEMFALVLIGLEIAAGFSVAYWAMASIAAALAKIDERSERVQESTERIAHYLAAGPGER